jgi:hypothetical protein
MISLYVPLILMHVQGQDGEVRWVMYQLGYIFTGLMGLIGLCVSGCWLAHIIVYMLPPIPIHPLLNEVFIKLDRVFPLFGVAAFAAFCGYLLGERFNGLGGIYGDDSSWYRVESAAALVPNRLHAWRLLGRAGMI